MNLGEMAGSVAEMAPEVLSETAHRYPLKPDRFSSHTLLLEEFDRDGQGQWVLDVGCGPGYLAKALAERGYEVVGVDNDRQALERVRGICREVIEADLECWEGPERRRFDYLVFADVLEHVRDPWRLIRSLLPVLNGRGTVVISIPNIAHLYARVMLLGGRWEYADRGLFDRTHLRFFTRASLMRFFNEVGLRPRRVSATSLPWSLLVERGPVWVRDALSWADHAAGRLWPTLFAYQFVVSADPEGSHE